MQIENCIALIEANPNAARRFYQLAVSHLSLDSIVHFMLNLHQVLLECAKLQDSEDLGGHALVPLQEAGDEEEGVASQQNMDAEEDAVIERDDHEHWTGAEEAEQSGDQKEDLSSKLRNKAILTGLLETLVVLWEGSREALQQTKAKALRGQLVEAVGRSLPVLFDRFKVRRGPPPHMWACIHVPYIRSVAQYLSTGYLLQFLSSFFGHA